MNVNFRYGSRRSILNNINMHIEAGAKIAIVGENGMGKSTIAKLLLNFYKPQMGKILFGNNLIDELNLTYLRSKIAYLTQDAILFKGMLEENLKKKILRLLGKNL
ncbi:MAG: ATP-binding cassette domain-containing protein [Oscillospiraceae bacterium]